MKTTDPLGQFEQLVLAAVSIIHEAYGITIHAKAQELAQRPLKIGAIYSTLDRLADKEYISSWMSAPTAQRGGRAKRCYRVENSGKIVLKESARTARRIYEALEEAWQTPLWKTARMK